MKPPRSAVRGPRAVRHPEEEQREGREINRGGYEYRSRTMTPKRGNHQSGTRPGSDFRYLSASKNLGPHGTEAEGIGASSPPRYKPATWCPRGCPNPIKPCRHRTVVVLLLRPPLTVPSGWVLRPAHQLCNCPGRRDQPNPREP